jgi:hypothetical protein
MHLWLEVEQNNNHDIEDVQIANKMGLQKQLLHSNGRLPNITHGRFTQICCYVGVQDSLSPYAAVIRGGSENFRNCSAFTTSCSFCAMVGKLKQRRYIKLSV